jgi:hypothetical protein
MSDATGRALYVRADLDGYAAMLAWDGPPRRADETGTVHTVTLAYGREDRPCALSSLTIAFPGLPWGANLPTSASLTQPELPHLLVAFQPGMNDDAVEMMLQVLPAEHRPQIPAILASLGRIASDQWRRELAFDDPDPSRPSTTLDRDRAVWPNPTDATIRADSETIEADLAVIEDLRARFARLVEGDLPAHILDDLPAHILDDLPAQTSKATHLAQIAIADAPTRRGWAPVDQDGAIVHRRQGEDGRVTVVLDPNALLGLQVASAFWDHTLGLAGMYGVAAVDVLVGMVRDDVQRSGAGMVTLALDDLARRIGMRQRTQAERLAARAQVFSIVRNFAAMRVEANTRSKVRSGGRLVDMSWYSPLIVIEDVQMPSGGQLAFDGSAPTPYAIRYRGSDVLLRQARLGNVALPVLGETSRRDAIPAGQPPGSWARAIFTAVVRLCRLRGSYTVSAPREVLLTMYAGAPHLDDVLSDRRSARRAVIYWTDALRILRTLDGEPMFDTIDDPTAPKGRGWARDWRKQVVTLQLHREAREVKGLDEVIAGRERYASTARPALPRPGRPSTRRARAD